MKRQIGEMESKLLKEIDRLQTENRSLVENIQYLHGVQGKPPKPPTPTKDNSSDNSSNSNAAARYLNISPIPTRPDSNFSQHANKMNALESELKLCKQEIVNTEQSCNKIIKIDQNRLDNVKVRFDEVKSNIEQQHASNSSPVQDTNYAMSAGSYDTNNNEISDTKEHFEVLR
jgi:hypothetical protein